jgi:hypothetical protein
VVVSSDASLLKMAGGLVGKLTQGHTDLHAQFFYVANNIQYGFELSLALPDSLPGGSHAEAAGAGSFGLPRLCKDGLTIHKPFGLYAGVVAGALGTVGAVLAAPAGFDAQKPAKLNSLFVTPVSAMGFPGLLKKIKERLVVDPGKFGKSLGAGRPQQHGLIVARAGKKVKRGLRVFMPGGEFAYE